MNILYFNPGSTSGANGRLITDPSDDIVFTDGQTEALRLIRKQRFDAVVIESETEDSKVLDFTLQLYGARPKLPVFLTNDWGADLARGLKDLATGAFAW